MSLITTLKFITNHPLNKSNKLKAFFRFVKWQINTMINPYPVIYPFTEKSKLIICKGMTGATGNLYCGLHDFSEMSFLLHFLRKDDIFVDVGANIGSYTILASAHVGACTIAFEPVLNTYNFLIKNISINQISDNVTAYNKAVGNNNGTINITSGFDTMNHISLKNEHNTLEVAVCKLDDILKEKIPALIKIDVEGFETEVLNGAEKILKSEQLKAIIIELNGSGNRYGYDEKKIHDDLINIGYSPYIYEPFKRQVVKTDSFGKNNTIYIKDINYVKQRICTADKINIHSYSY